MHHISLHISYELEYRWFPDSTFWAGGPLPDPSHMDALKSPKSKSVTSHRFFEQSSSLWRWVWQLQRLPTVSWNFSLQMFEMTAEYCRIAQCSPISHFSFKHTYFCFGPLFGDFFLWGRQEPSRAGKFFKRSITWVALYFYQKICLCLPVRPFVTSCLGHRHYQTISQSLQLFWLVFGSWFH